MEGSEDATLAALDIEEAARRGQEPGNVGGLRKSKEIDSALGIPWLAAASLQPLPSLSHDLLSSVSV